MAAWCAARAALHVMCRQTLVAMMVPPVDGEVVCAITCPATGGVSGVAAGKYIALNPKLVEHLPRDGTPEQVVVLG